jgi:hypothetical protein
LALGNLTLDLGLLSLPPGSFAIGCGLNASDLCL